MRTQKIRFVTLVLVVAVLAAFPLSASANHSWGNYHWARTSNPFTVKVIDSMSSSWDDNLNVAISDWHASSVLNVVKEAGSDGSTARRRCRPVSGHS